MRFGHGGESQPRAATMRDERDRGDLDRNVVVENGLYQAGEIPDATLHRVSGAGHWLVRTHFDDIIAAATTI